MTDAAARLPRRFARLTALNILANVAVPLAGLVDVAMLGHLSDLSFLAGVALATILFDYLYWTFGFLRMGTTGVTAQALGRGDDAEVHLTLYRALAFAAGTGAAILLLQVPLGELGFLLLSGGPAVEAAGREYFAARIWAAPAALANFAFLGWYLGREESGRALVMTVVGGFANIGFNYLFIVRLGLAARGAGLGTMTSQYLMLAVAAGMFLARPRPPVPGWPAVADRQRLAGLIRLNGDILVRTVCLLTTFALFLNFSSLLGTATLAVNTVLHRLLNFAAFLIDGAAFATESLGGILRGAGSKGGLKRLLGLAFATGESFALLFLAALLAVPATIYGWLTSHAEVIAAARVYGPWLGPVLIFGAVAYVYDGLFIGLTAGRVLRNSMLVFGEGCISAVLPRGAGAHGVPLHLRLRRQRAPWPQGRRGDGVGLGRLPVPMRARRPSFPARRGRQSSSRMPPRRLSFGSVSTNVLPAER